MQLEKIIEYITHDFSEWDLYKIGHINESGNLISLPPGFGSANNISQFMCRSIRKGLNEHMIAYIITDMCRYNSLSYDDAQKIMEAINTCDHYKNIYYLVEDVVAGDSGGNPDKIAQGTTTGSVTNKGPGYFVKPGKRKGSKAV